MSIISQHWVPVWEHNSDGFAIDTDNIESFQCMLGCNESHMGHGTNCNVIFEQAYQKWKEKTMIIVMDTKSIIHIFYYTKSCCVQIMFYTSIYQ